MGNYIRLLGELEPPEISSDAELLEIEEQARIALRIKIDLKNLTSQNDQSNN